MGDKEKVPDTESPQVGEFIPAFLAELRTICTEKAVDLTVVALLIGNLILSIVQTNDTYYQNFSDEFIKNEHSLINYAKLLYASIIIYLLDKKADGNE